MGEVMHTLFLNCLWMASSASLIVTPLRFRAVTSSPSGKCRSIFLIGGSVSIFFRMSLSSTVDGEVLTFLYRQTRQVSIQVPSTLDSTGDGEREQVGGLPSSLLCLGCYFQLNLLLLCSRVY